MNYQLIEKFFISFDLALKAAFFLGFKESETRNNEKERMLLLNNLFDHRKW